LLQLFLQSGLTSQHSQRLLFRPLAARRGFTPRVDNNGRSVRRPVTSDEAKEDFRPADGRDTGYGKPLGQNGENKFFVKLIHRFCFRLPY
jgi:hypothetical protein